jgi:hypothetical protein
LQLLSFRFLFANDQSYNYHTEKKTTFPNSRYSGSKMIFSKCENWFEQASEQGTVALKCSEKLSGLYRNKKVLMSIPFRHCKILQVKCE